MVEVACPSCSAVYKVPETILGRNIRCKGCQTSFVAAAAGPAPPANAPADESPAVNESPPPVGRSGRGRALVVVALVGMLAAIGVAGWLWLGAGGARWEEFTSSEGGFAVLVPTTPTPAKANDPKLNVAMHEFVAKPARSTSSYTVQYADLPDKPVNEYLYYAWMKNNLLAATAQSKVALEQEVAAGPHAGRHLALDLPDEQRLTRRMYIVENRMYLVSAQHPRAASTDVDKFLDSFKITNPPKSSPKPTETATPPPPPTQVVVAPPPPPPPMTLFIPPPSTKPVPTAKGKTNPPPPTEFNQSAEERSLLEEINRLRAMDKVPPLQAEKKFFDAARSEATALARKQAGKILAFPGYRNIYRFTVPAKGVVPPALLVQGLGADKRTRRELVDPGFQEVGIGISKAADGTTIYVILLAGNSE